MFEESTNQFNYSSAAGGLVIFMDDVFRRVDGENAANAANLNMNALEEVR